MRNTYKYTKLYSGGTPEFIEGNVFKTMIPLSAVSVGKVGPSQSNLVTDQVTDQVNRNVDGIEKEQDVSQHIKKSDGSLQLRIRSKDVLRLNCFNLMFLLKRIREKSLITSCQKKKRVVKLDL